MPSLNEQPNIPVAHFLKEVHKAMELSLAHPGTLKDLLSQQAKTSRPWSFLLEAYENHDHSTEWFENWCRNCLRLL